MVAGRSDYVANAGDQSNDLLGGCPGSQGQAGYNQAAAMDANHNWPNSDGSIGGSEPASGICYFHSQVTMNDVTTGPRTRISSAKNTSTPTITPTARTMRIMSLCLTGMITIAQG